jgi:hypothetical protein
VQQDLKMTADQVKRAADAFRKVREATVRLDELSEEEIAKKEKEIGKEAAKTVAGFLAKAQVKRLKQISLQVQGPFADGAGARELKITAEQKEKFKKLEAQVKKDMLKIITQAGNNFEEIRKRGLELRNAMREKALKLLSDEQRAKWKEMTGKPFNGAIEPMTFVCMVHRAGSSTEERTRLG